LLDRFIRAAAAVAVAVSTTVVLIPPAAAAARPDLSVTALSKPPASLRRGRTFNITDTTKNVGKAKAKASTTRYYLSKDNKRGGLTDIRLAKSRKVKILGRGKAHKGTVKGVVVPKTIAPASYFLLACADDLKKVKESNEKNNCRSSTTKMTVSGAPPPPNITSTEPVSPSNVDDTPVVKGTAEAGSTVRVYEEVCTGLLVATGSVVDFGSIGLQITNPVVSDGSAVNYVATATDGVGNVSACSGAEPYEYDVDPPDDVDFVTSPSAISNQNPAQWTWTGEPGATFECALVKGSTPVDTASCDGSTYTSPDLTTMPEWGDGTYTFSITQTDDAGNVASGPTTDEFILDLTPPGDATILTEPTSPSNDPMPAWTFDGTLALDAHYECQLRRNGTVVQAFTACGDPDPTKTYDLSNATTYPDGTYVFEVQQVDEAGNTSENLAVSTGFVLDRVALAPTFEQEPNDPSNDATPAWEFSGEAGATFECMLRDGTNAVLGGPTDCTTDTTYTFDLSDDVTYPDGNYSLSVSQIDAASNPSSAGTSTFELDRQAPDAPAIDSSPDDPSNDVTPTWTFSSSEPGPVTFQCELKRGLTTVASGACNGGSFTPGVALVDQGIYTLEVRQTDGATNQSAAASSNFELDTDRPAAPTFSVVPDDPSNDTTPTWSWTGETGATYECTLSKNAVEVQTVSCDSATYTAPDLVSSGAITLEVVQTDEAGNVSLTSVTDDFELDTVDPVAPSSLTSTPASPGNVGTPTISGSVGSEVGAGVELFAGSDCGATPAGTGLTNGSGAFSITSTVSVPVSSEATFSARATDEAGNLGPCSAGYLYEHVVFESETNNDTASADPVGEAPAVVVGEVSMTDPSDYWSVFVPHGAAVKLQTFDRSDGSMCTADAALTFYDTTGTELVSDDQGGNGGAGPCALIDGFGEVPLDLQAANLQAPGGEGGTYFIEVTQGAAALLNIVSYRLVVEVDGDVIESEPNNGFNNQGTPDTSDDTFDSDGNITDDVLIEGALSPASDRDFFKLNLPEARVVRFDSYDPNGECPTGMQTTLAWFHPNAIPPISTETNRFRTVDGRSAFDAGGINQCASLTMLVPAGISYIQIEEAGRNTTVGAYVIQVDVLDVEVPETETNDDSGSADPIPLDGETYVAGIFEDGDQDWYSFTLTSTTSVRLETFEGGLDVPAGGSDPNCESSSIQTQVALYASNGSTQLGSDSSDGRGGCSIIDGLGGTSARDPFARDLAPGTYFVRVSSASTSAPQPSFDYRLAIVTPQP
jgi:hypothetical protein